MLKNLFNGIKYFVSNFSLTLVYSIFVYFFTTFAILLSILFLLYGLPPYFSFYSTPLKTILLNIHPVFLFLILLVWCLFFQFFSLFTISFLRRTYKKIKGRSVQLNPAKKEVFMFGNFIFFYHLFFVFLFLLLIEFFKNELLSFVITILLMFISSFYILYFPFSFVKKRKNVKDYLSVSSKVFSKNLATTLFYVFLFSIVGFVINYYSLVIEGPILLLADFLFFALMFFTFFSIYLETEEHLKS